MKFYSKVFKKTLRKIILKQSQNVPLDLRSNLIENTLVCKVIAGNQPVFLNVPGDKLRIGQMGFPATIDSPSYVIKSAKQYIKNPDIELNKTELYRFYQNYKPRNSAEAMDIPSDTEGSDFQLLSPLAVTVPWGKAPGRPTLNSRIDALRRDAQQFGIKLENYNGTTSFGPADSQIIEMEWFRIKRAVDQLRRSNMARQELDSHPITGRLMLDKNGDYAVIISDGNHRTAAFAALGATKVSLLLK